MLRGLLAMISALCECYFYRAIVKEFHRRIALFTLVILIFSPGMYIASASEALRFPSDASFI